MNYSSAQQGMKDLKAFYTNCMWFGIVTIILFFRKFFRTGNLSESLFGISFILIIWAVILTVKAVKLFILNAEWENKILKEEIRKVK